MMNLLLLVRIANVAPLVLMGHHVAISMCSGLEFIHGESLIVIKAYF